MAIFFFESLYFKVLQLACPDRMDFVGYVQVRICTYDVGLALEIVVPVASGSHSKYDRHHKLVSRLQSRGILYMYKRSDWKN